MAQFGLFTRQEAKTFAPSRKKSRPGKLPPNMTEEQLHKLGLKGVRQMNVSARTPEMDPAGVAKPLVYLLGEAPGEQEDQRGEPFVGPSGRFLKRRLPDDWEDISRFNNVVRTRPPNNRLPERVEVECFRPSVVADIEAAKPAIIVGLGNVALDWMIGDMGSIKTCRGRRFAVQVGRHKCWFYPTVHPSYVLHELNAEGKHERGEIPADEWERVFKLDLARAYKDAPNVETPDIEDPEHLWDGVQVVEGGNPAVVERFLEEIVEEKIVAFDLETNRKRPYSKGAKVLSASVGTYEKVMAFAIDHPQAKWTTEARARVVAAFLKFLRSPKCSKVAHHLTFELEWLMFMFGRTIRRRSTWHCTRAQAYVLDERRDGQSLDFLNTMHFGLRLKAMSTTKADSKFLGLALQSEEKIDRNKLEFTRLNDVLRYNALDSKYDSKLERVQRKMLKEVDLWSLYKFQRESIPSLANAQRQGLPVDRDQQKAFADELKRDIDKAQKELRELSGIKKYQKQYGEFSDQSNPQLVVLFRDVLQRHEGRRGKRYSTDEEALSMMKGCPESKAILKVRKLRKLKSTYIDRYDIAHPKTYVYPDGKIHCNFNSTDTATGRTNSDNPNNQNWPKRKEARIRKLIAAPVGRAAKQYWESLGLPNYGDCCLLAADHGQLEYRVSAMVSKDPVIIKYIWDEHDIHGEWAERIAKVAPHCRERWEGHKKGWLKALRDEVKNEWVFARLFGSSWKSIGRNMEMEVEQVNQLRPLFDRKLKGVLAWQKQTARFYDEHGYVETLTKRRRRAPMNWNMLINHPIQGTAREIVCDGMDRLDRWSLDKERDMPWLGINLNIHDDLTVIAPIAKRDETIEALYKAMLETSRVFKWINVPLNVEVSTGANWFEMSEVGKFMSNKVSLN